MHLLLLLTTLLLGADVLSFAVLDNEDKGPMDWAMEISVDFEDIIREHLEPYLEDEEALSHLELYFESLQDDSAGCTACKAAITATRLIARRNPWEVVREVVVELCLNASIPLGVRGDVLCPGILDLQGPHVYDIVLNATSEQVCETLNRCIPPAEEDSLTDRKPHKPLVHKKRSLEEIKERKAKNSLRLVQLADIHIEIDYEEGTSTECGLPVCCFAEYGEGTAGAWGDYRCNIPDATMYHFLENVARLSPDMLIYSGDSPPHSMWEETFESQMDCTKRVVDAVHETIPGVPVYPNIGNHEMYPTNLYYLGLEETLAANVLFSSLWEDAAGFGQEQKDTMVAAGYYAMPIGDGLTIISYNGNFGYTANFYNALMYDQPEIDEMFEFMQAQLDLARENGDKVIMVGHHPVQGMNARVGRIINRIIVDNADVIIMHLSGHTHNDHFHLFTNDDGEAVTMSYTAPAVTSILSINPSARIYYLDEDTYEVLDYEQYHMDLREIYETGAAPTIKYVYSALEEYEMQDMNPESWQELIDRFEEDDELFDKYARNYFTRFPGEDYECTGTCRLNHLCRMRHAVVDTYRDCQNSTLIL